MHIWLLRMHLRLHQKYRGDQSDHTGSNFWPNVLLRIQAKSVQSNNLKLVQNYNLTCYQTNSLQNLWSHAPLEFWATFQLFEYALLVQIWSKHVDKKWICEYFWTESGFMNISGPKLDLGICPDPKLDPHILIIWPPLFYRHLTFQK